MGDGRRRAEVGIVAARLGLGGLPLAVCALLLVGGGTGRAGQCREAEAMPDGGWTGGLAATPSASPPAAAVGAPFQLGPWAVVIAGAGTQAEVPDFGGMSATGTFLVVRLHVTNRGNCPVVFPYDAMRVVDGRGRVHPLDVPATDFHLRTDGPETVDGTSVAVPPGAAVGTNLVFDVPPDAAGFVLEAGDAAVALDPWFGGEEAAPEDVEGGGAAHRDVPTIRPFRRRRPPVAVRRARESGTRVWQTGSREAPPGVGRSATTPIPGKCPVVIPNPRE